MQDASAHELLLLSALQESRLRLDEARRDEAARDALTADLREARDRVRTLEEAVAQERERTEAVRLVLAALAASIGRFGLRRRAFLARIAEAGRATPDSGPASVRHPVLLAEARRVLGREDDAAADPPGPERDRHGR